LSVFVASILLDEVDPRRPVPALERAARHRPTATWRLATRNRRRVRWVCRPPRHPDHGGGGRDLSGLSVDTTVTLAPGDSARIGPYTVTHERLVTSRWRAMRG
jgi:hypothetical protein